MVGIPGKSKACRDCKRRRVKVGIARMLPLTAERFPVPALVPSCAVLSLYLITRFLVRLDIAIVH